MTTRHPTIIVLLLLPLLLGCATTRTYDHNRISVSEDRTEGTLGISSKDLVQISRDVAEGLLSSKAVSQATVKPKIAFVSVTNNSSDFIDTNIFLRRIRALLMEYADNKILFLDRSILHELSVEKENQASGEFEGTRTNKFLGTDYILTGTIDSIDRAWGDERSSYFRCSFRLVEPDTSVIVWEKQSEFKKTRKRPLYDR